MPDYIYYIIYGLFGIFALIGLIVNIPEWIDKFKNRNFSFKNLLEYIPDVLKFVYFFCYCYSLYCVSTLESIVDITICGIVLIPVMFYLVVVKPDKDKKIKELQEEIEKLKNK